MQKILIIEDEEPLQKVLYEKLKKEKFKIIQAYNGQEGLKLAKKEKPDLILLDIIMPVKDGLTMLKELRKDSWGKKAKVIILTNLNDADNVANALENKAYDFLVKSDWRLEDVVKKIKEKIG